MIRKQTRRANKKHSRCARSARNKERVYLRQRNSSFSQAACFLIAHTPQKWSKNEHLVAARAARARSLSHKSVINFKAQKQSQRKKESERAAADWIAPHQSRGGVLSFYLNQWSVFAVSKHTPALEAGADCPRFDSVPLNLTANSKRSWPLLYELQRGPLQRNAISEKSIEDICFEIYWSSLITNRISFFISHLKFKSLIKFVCILAFHNFITFRA